MLNLKTRIREVYRDFVNPRQAKACREYTKVMLDECTADAIRQFQSNPSNPSVIIGRAHMDFTREEVQQLIAENQRKAGM